MAACASVAFGQGEVSVGKPFINVSGLTKLQNGSYACLVGQQIGCLMGFLGTAPPLPTYSWTLPPNVFDSYVIQKTSAVWNKVQSSQLTQSSITFCFSPISGLPQTQEETVSCTATSGSNQYTASATIEVEEPSITENMNLVLGKFDYLPNATSPLGCVVMNSGFIYDFNGTGENVGAALSLTVTDPPDFTAINQTGTWAFVQCVDGVISGTYYTNGVEQNITDPYNGTFECDGAYPYPQELTGTSQPPPPGGAFFPTAQEGTYYDAPGITGLSGYGAPVSWTDTLTFSPYAFYVPPTPPSGFDYPVPLEMWPWAAAGGGASGSPWAISTNSVTSGGATTAPSSPEWSVVGP